MPPEAVSVARVLDRTVTRARCLAAAQAAAVGAAFAAWSPLVGLAIAMAVAVAFARRVSRQTVIQDLERANPQARNLLVTFDEAASGALAVKPVVLDRIVRDTSALVPALDRRIPSARRVLWLVSLAAVAWLAAFAGRTWIRRPIAMRATVAVAPNAVPANATAPHVVVTIEPPAYTHRAPSTYRDPTQLEAIENSRLRLGIDSIDGEIAVEVNGERRPVQRGADGRYELTTVLARSGYMAVDAADGRRRTIAVTVTPDALPSVRVTAPGRDLLYSGGNPRLAFEVKAADDFGLRSLALRFTKVSGSGEQFAFTDGEIPLSVARATEKEWTGTVERQLSDLGLHEGDVLVYQAVAADVRPSGGEASSDAFFIEISKLGVAAGDAFTLPEEESRYALSQQMLIVKTERLIQRRAARGAMTAADVAQESQGLAVEQRMIRSEFVFMLGGEIEDEEIEAQQSTELQEGRLANRGQRDLRTATVTMSRAEKLLTDANLADALVMERAAVAALQRAFARDRYILRSLASRTQLDASRRLTGVAPDTAGWRRQAATPAQNRRPAFLQDLLQGLGELSAAVRGGSDVTRQLGVLAEFAVRIDADSSTLRQLAADLQHLADVWPTLATDVRLRALDAIVDAATREARQALEDAPLAAATGERR